ncbi:hypothetical protein CN498_21790 [Bacillus thuringiensis]|jgi:hypothetical protein|nr:hypothetical protein AMR94_02045 [Bacillus sp. G3(2015)]PEC95211.1 hypothetical protein CON17_20150 [Bacillus thuringiensis]PER85417.1 hypothetical protein CN498_21790 [Bacillus thuringiensis]PEV23352.1 hypothetical protein CN420_19875 [Bacillus thuringiensis]PFS77115.1 hypothetical protein COK50_07830 [Bacillus thuringiensis]
MRNILVFPDGTEQDFLYPDNRVIFVGEKLQVQMQCNSVHILEIYNIQHTDKIIYYHLKY